MTVGRGGSVDTVRAAAADLELVEQARQAVLAAEAHLTEVVREVVDRRALTVEQVAHALGIGRSGLYKRLAR